MTMPIWTLLLLSVAFREGTCLKRPQFHRGSDPPASFEFTTDDQGNFAISQGTTVWLKNAPTFLSTDGVTYTSEDGSLKLNQSFAENGTDKMGTWKSTCYLYVAGKRLFKCCAKTWETPFYPAIVFQQTFVNGTNMSAQDVNDVISGFPAIQVPEDQENLGFLQYQGGMFGSGNIGIWKQEAVKGWRGGLEGGPLSLFDPDGNVVIIAPFSQFMSASRSVAQPDRISWGVMGGVMAVPVGYQYETIVFYGYTGINQVYSDWGKLMRYYYNKDDYYRKTDFTLNYLGFWTDGGAYYFYNTEPNKTYERTILDVKNYSDSVNIPYRYVQYDSWFYPKGPRGGVTTWTPAPDIAPDGFQYIYNITLWPAGAHNRWWSASTPYPKANGGKFNFIVEPNMAIPQDFGFWMYLFQQSKLWGLILYEQDHMNQQFQQMNATLTTVDVARTWLMQMGTAARANGLTIQYCMSNPRHGMQSLEIPVVTQARVSGDYRAGRDNWQIGINSIFADAMGIAPFKDNFWTTKVQPGNTYNLSEPNGELQAAVATVSTGPVGPSDMIGHTNIAMLMQCCAANGLILRPSKPAMAIDKEIWERAWGGSGPSGEVWTTYSVVGPWTFGIVFASAMESPFQLTPTDAGFDFFKPSVVFRRSTPGAPSAIKEFSKENPLVLDTSCTRLNICMYYTSPIFKVGNSSVVIYGEENKFVPMSPDRVFNIDYLTDSLHLVVLGTTGESTVFTFLVDGTIHRVPCTFGESGRANVQYNAAGCGVQSAAVDMV